MWGTPFTSLPSWDCHLYSARSRERYSLCSTEVVPTSTGRPSQWHDTMRSATAFHRAAAVRNIAWGLSTRSFRLCVGTVTTESLYVV